MGRRNLSQSALAQPIGMTQQALSRRLTGQVPFTIDELTAIARTLGCPLTALINDDDEEIAS
jgi:transcriptional regulator with XRE-family HTH domain